MTTRFIGIRHRVKRSAKGEARPTLVAIKEGDDLRVLELEIEQDELDFLLGRFPLRYRKATGQDDLSAFPPHRITWRELKDGETPESVPANLLRTVDDEVRVADKVPDVVEGLRSEDVVGMSLGGSGDRLAYALSRRGQEIGAQVFRVPPFLLAQRRGNAKKEEDHLLLVTLVATERQIFYLIGPRDRAMIAVSEAFRTRQLTLKDLLACGQRLRSNEIGRIFLNAEGRYPEGAIEAMHEAARAASPGLRALGQEERDRSRDLERAVEELDVYGAILKPIEGCGPRIAAGLLAAVVDIRRFSSPAKLKKFCGVHVLPDGRFPRQRHGSNCNWTPSARQSLYLLADQFVKRKNSVWGQRLRENKTRLRQRHPEAIVVEGKKRYTNGHIHQMAIWRTLSQFVVWFHKAWWKFERELAGQAVPGTGPQSPVQQQTKGPADRPTTEAAA